MKKAKKSEEKTYTHAEYVKEFCKGKDYGWFVVVDTWNRPIEIFTDKDQAERFARNDCKVVRVREVASNNVP